MTKLKAGITSISIMIVRQATLREATLWRFDELPFMQRNHLLSHYFVLLFSHCWAVSTVTAHTTKNRVSAASSLVILFVPCSSRTKFNNLKLQTSTEQLHSSMLAHLDEVYSISFAKQSKPGGKPYVELCFGAHQKSSGLADHQRWPNGWNLSSISLWFCNCCSLAFVTNKWESVLFSQHYAKAWELIVPLEVWRCLSTKFTSKTQCMHTLSNYPADYLDLFCIGKAFIGTSAAPYLLQYVKSSQCDKLHRKQVQHNAPQWRHVHGPRH